MRDLQDSIPMARKRAMKASLLTLRSITIHSVTILSQLSEINT
jgi:hypothetical protein